MKDEVDAVAKVCCLLRSKIATSVSDLVEGVDRGLVIAWLRLVSGYGVHPGREW